MAEITQNNNDHGNKNRSKKHSTRMDMTPMVDLAFLLLTFFMLTTTFNKPKTMEVNLPVKGDPTLLPDNTVTILLDKKHGITYYQGPFETTNKSDFHRSSFTDDQIRNELMELNQKLYEEISEIEADYSNHLFNDSIYKTKIEAAKNNKTNEGVSVIIKSTDDAPYRSLVYLLDEMKICGIVNYSIVDITKEEEEVLKEL